MNEDWREREADLRSEYEAEAAYEAGGYDCCSHSDDDDAHNSNYNLIDIFDVHNGYVFFQIKCVDCDKFREIKIPEQEVVDVIELCLFNRKWTEDDSPLHGFLHGRWVYR